MSYRVVWFKRDLRVQDHWPLHEAARRGPVLCLYVVEPSLWAQPDAAAQHYGFVRESLQELDAQGRVTLHRDYWDAAEELYEKLPWVGGLMRWLKRRANQ